MSQRLLLHHRLLSFVAPHTEATPNAAIAMTATEPPSVDAMIGTATAAAAGGA